MKTNLSTLNALQNCFLRWRLFYNFSFGFEVLTI